MKGMLAGMTLVSTLFTVGWAHEMTPEKTKQLKAIFPEAAQFREQHLSLNGQQVKAVEKMIRGKLSSKHKKPPIFKASVDSQVIGFIAYFEAKEPDGDISPAAVGIRPDDTIAKVVIFTHHAEDNPLAGRDFLDQFEGKKAGDGEAWHPDHTVKLVPGKGQDSLNAMKAIRLTAAILTVGKGVKTQAHAEPQGKHGDHPHMEGKGHAHEEGEKEHSH